MRWRFLWRIALLLMVLFFFTFGGFSLLFWFGAGMRGGGPGFPHGPFFAARGLFMLILVLTVIGVITAGRAFRRVTAPVGAVMEAAGRVAEGEYGTRVVERGPPEVRALARAFNQMAARLETSDRQRRNLLAEVTHELRTPLAVIQGNLEGLLDGIYPRDDAHLGPVLEEARLLARLIEDLRTLALAEAGALPLRKEGVDLGELVVDVAASFRAQADAASIAFSVEAGDLPPVEVDPTRIREVAENLIANALHYTPAGGTIRVTAAAQGVEAVRRAVITVADSGGGIAPDELPHIFDRFYKSKDSRGSGLGLTIAKNLVEAHGGEITAESAPGQGTTIRVTLPVNPPPP
ncbi:MAG TPA: HAMP domain-containing sensor histidine kinase [bacterium]|jgi:signal transduction histidine kinase|nr:HAMP domain-containing sensor histidine kinase [bacterium]